MMTVRAAGSLQWTLLAECYRKHDSVLKKVVIPSEPPTWKKREEALFYA